MLVLFSELDALLPRPQGRRKPLPARPSGFRKTVLLTRVARCAGCDFRRSARCARGTLAALLSRFAPCGACIVRDGSSGQPLSFPPERRPALPRVARPARGAGTRSRPRGMGRGARCRGLRAATQRARDEERNERSDVSTAVGWGGSWPRLGGLKGAVHGGYAAVSSGSFASRCPLDSSRAPQALQRANAVSE